MAFAARTRPLFRALVQTTPLPSIRRGWRARFSAVMIDDNVCGQQSRSSYDISGRQMLGEERRFAATTTGLCSASRYRLFVSHPAKVLAMVPQASR